MTTLNKVDWSNWFAYGQDNELVLDAESVTQLVGANGAGKSSIQLIIEEMFYGKNSKKTSKSDLCNRYSGISKIDGELTFTEGNSVYLIKLSRASSPKLSLYKDDVDISAHRTADTYKKIEAILGYDHKTFCQIVAQSSNSSLEFLTATDLNRKKFLISLLGLDSYIELNTAYKDIIKDSTADLNVMRGSITTIQSILAKYSKVSRAKEELLPEIVIDDKAIEQVVTLKNSLANLDKENKLINDNNARITRLGNLPPCGDRPDEVIDIANERSELAVVTAKLVDNTNLTKGIDSLGVKCPTCYQKIGEELKASYLLRLTNSREVMIERSNYLTCLIKENSTKATYKKAFDKLEKETFELSNSIIKDMPTENILRGDLNKELLDLTADIASLKVLANSTRIDNEKIIAANALTEQVISQELDYIAELNQLLDTLEELEAYTKKLHILRDTFGTSGIVSYKIEYLVKTLESNINEYLAELSSGKFLLTFKQEGAKLNVVITNSSKDVSISTLSDGELYRVNISTLLALRKTLTGLIGKDINILFLDEVYGVLDKEGKDILTNILLRENLNTFLVAHDYVHPNIKVVHIEKDGEISSLRYGR